jgi:hypothetical protein
MAGPLAGLDVVEFELCVITPMSLNWPAHGCRCGVFLVVHGPSGPCVAHRQTPDSTWNSIDDACRTEASRAQRVNNRGGCIEAML